MPAVFELTCDTCKEPFACKFHNDGSIAIALCKCPWTYAYSPGGAWLRPHWWMLRAVKAAETVSNRLLQEFTDLEGAIHAMKEMNREP